MQPFSAPLLAITLAAASCAQNSSAPSSSTPSREVLVALAGDGEVVETERTPTHSLMQVRRAPAGSVPSSMYALRGACAILRARGKNYVASVRLADSPATYRLTFPVSPSPEDLRGATKSVFTLGECIALRF